MLPGSRNMEGYLSADNLMRMMTNVSRVVDEPPPPAFPRAGVPAGMVAGPVGEGGYQFDLALPTELIVAIKEPFFTNSAHRAESGSRGGSKSYSRRIE